MTIQEMYDWAKKNNCLNIPVSKHIDMEFYDVRNIVHLNSEIAILKEYAEDYDRVVID